ncbi:MAG: DUF1501 domain-containing protein [Myxococcota bacterium]
MNRRNFLKFGVTGGTVAVMSPWGGPLLPNTTSAFRIPEECPSRFLTIYAPGGWMPSMFFAPFQDESMVGVHWPGYLAAPNQVENLDGSGGAPNDEDPRYGRIRVPAIWDEALMVNPANFTGGGGWPAPDPKPSYGYAWRHYNLAENTCVIHGVDQQTAEHFSGRQAALSGVAGARFSVPAIHCVAAHAHAMAGTSRPLGAVSIKTGGPWGTTPKIDKVGLPAHANPTTIGGIASLSANFSDTSPAWDGIRHRDTIAVADYFDMNPVDIPLTRMDQFALNRFRKFRGLSDDSFYQGLYEAHVGMSQKMALDLVSVLESTPGWESPHPHWSSGNSPYQLSVGRVYGDGGQTWNEQFELVLKLFKADVCTAINVQAPGPNGEGFDIHGSGEANMKDLFNRTRGTMEVIGRLLGEMKATPNPSGEGSLLDDTLVMLVSEFGRSWPQLSTSNGHWPFTSYIFCGGGIMTNRMIGDYDLDPAQANNPTGVEVELVDGGMKHPAARDVAHTAHRILGIPEGLVEISGGPNEIAGVRAQ